jgi:membrane-bound serine protease (ClpP class)
MRLSQKLLRIGCSPFFLYLFVLFLFSLPTTIPIGPQLVQSQENQEVEPNSEVTVDDSTVSEKVEKHEGVVDRKRVLLLDMKMAILPGTMGYLESAIETASKNSYDLIVVRLSTPGGMLNTSQDMIQMIFESPVPIAMYVSPAGGSATSAGVFITMAAHIAAMAPGTSIGAAHPVSGEGKDIEGDMRAKVENMASAMVKSISDRRGRNGDWAVKAVRESSSVTVDEAIKLGVVDIKADTLEELFSKLEGRKVDVKGSEVTLTGFQESNVESFPMSLRYIILNFLANPSVAAILWLIATTGIGVELYNPGLIFPGVAGALCLVLALISMQVLPLSEGAVVLLVVGTMMILAESYITTGLLGLGGIMAIIVGLIYFVDTSQAPNLYVQLEIILPFAALLISMLACLMWVVVSSRRSKALTGYMGLVGQIGHALEDFQGEGRVMVEGEIWKAMFSGSIKKDQAIKVKGRGAGLSLLVEPSDKTPREG